LQIRPSENLLAVRRDWVESTWETWYSQSYLLNRWNTQVVVGTSTDPQAQGSSIKVTGSAVLNINDFIPCMPPPVCNANGTLVVKVTSGPEDPRIFSYNGSTYISFFSYDNINNENAAYDPTSYQGYYGTGTKICVPTSDGLIGRMYVSKIYPVPPNACMLEPLIPINQGSFQFANYSIIKNWLAFSDGESDLYFIHQISPQFIVMKIVFVSDIEWFATVDSTSDTPREILDLDLFETSDQDDPSVVDSSSWSAIASNIHGSVNPVYVNAEQSSWGKSYYLSIFHVISSSSQSSSYASYAFSFDEFSRPFKISALSSRLPLNLTGYSFSTCGRKFPFAFVSGLEIAGCQSNATTACLLISYGVCDLESRISVMSLQEFEINMMHRLLVR